MPRQKKKNPSHDERTEPWYQAEVHDTYFKILAPERWVFPLGSLFCFWGHFNFVGCVPYVAALYYASENKVFQWGRSTVMPPIKAWPQISGSQQICNNAGSYDDFCDAVQSKLQDSGLGVECLPMRAEPLPTWLSASHQWRGLAQDIEVKPLSKYGDVYLTLDVLSKYYTKYANTQSSIPRTLVYDTSPPDFQVNAGLDPYEQSPAGFSPTAEFSATQVAGMFVHPPAGSVCSKTGTQMLWREFPELLARAVIIYARAGLSIDAENTQENLTSDASVYDVARRYPVTNLFNQVSVSPRYCIYELADRTEYTAAVIPPLTREEKKDLVLRLSPNSELRHRLDRAVKADFQAFVSVPPVLTMPPVFSDLPETNQTSRGNSKNFFRMNKQSLQGVPQTVYTVGVLMGQ